MNHTDQVISEILQIKEQYEAQVTGRHKQWPRAIKDRVAALVAADVRLMAIAKRTGISYHTLSSWTPRPEKALFREVAVVAAQKQLATAAKKSTTVMRPKKPRVVTAVEKSITVTVTISTPDGYAISVNSVEGSLSVLRGLRCTNGRN